MKSIIPAILFGLVLIIFVDDAVALNKDGVMMKEMRSQNISMNGTTSCLDSKQTT